MASIHAKQEALCDELLREYTTPQDILLMGDLNILADSQWLATETVPTPP